jgi:hypothetical protein
MKRRKLMVEAEEWRCYMPRRGNGGVPQQQDVDLFMAATENNPELLQKVIGELRKRLQNRVVLQLGILAAGLTAITIVSSFLPKGSDLIAQASAGSTDVDFIIWIIAGTGIMVTFVYALGVYPAIYIQDRARHAESYFAAYKEALDARNQQPAPKHKPTKTRRVRSRSPRY